MKIKVTCNYTSSVLDALTTAGRYNYSWEYTGTRYAKSYSCRGYKFSSTKKFCDWMIKELEDWMLANNVADIEPLEKAVYSTMRHIPCFEITE